MKKAFAWFLLLPAAHACGPWFPDSILDKPQAILQVPPVCYEDALDSLFPEPATYSYPPFGKDVEELVADQNLGADENAPLMQQIPWEVAELMEWWKSQGIAPDESAARAKRYIALRRSQLSAVRVVDFRSVQLAEAPQNPAVDPALADILPPDVFDFAKASEHLLAGRIPEARAIWKSITARPSAEKKFRAAWAAWMLAKTSENEADALAAYEATMAEVAAGSKDCLLLGPAAAAWLGPRQEDPVRRLQLLLHAWRHGHPQALIDLRRQSQKTLAEATEDELALLARDPLCRQLLVIEVFTTLDGPMEYFWWDEGKEKSPFPYAKWLKALEVHAPRQVERAERMAWALYSCGEYQAAKRWLAMADPGEPRALWLKAKFAVREGKVDLADRSLGRAIAKTRRQPNWGPNNMVGEELNYLDTEFTRQMEQARLMTDAAVLKMARGEFIAALDHLVEANYWEDAAYVAEYVLTTDELVSVVRKKAPRWSPALNDWWTGKNPGHDAPLVLDPAAKHMPDIDLLADGGTRRDDLRYLLGRRLTREFRFREAREFMPVPMLPLYDRFVALHRAARSGKYKAAELAAIEWELAVLTRRFGMEILGTESTPDSHQHGGTFGSMDFLLLRRHRQGWKTYWDMKDLERGPPVPLTGLPPHRLALPVVLAEEIRRAEKHLVSPNRRFHYRYLAADHAWKAADNLPDNTNAKAYMLNTAGLWLANRDPEAADRFYKALVRKNWSHPLGQAADRKRWFLSLDAPPDLPELPAGLKP